MDSSFREQGSVNLIRLPNLIKWLVSLIKLTEEEQEEAGIYIDRLWDE